jgi:hypothetical protein
MSCMWLCASPFARVRVCSNDRPTSSACACVCVVRVCVRARVRACVRACVRGLYVCVHARLVGECVRARSFAGSGSYPRTYIHGLALSLSLARSLSPSLLSYLSTSPSHVCVCLCTRAHTHRPRLHTPSLHTWLAAVGDAGECERPTLSHAHNFSAAECLPREIKHKRQLSRIHSHRCCEGPQPQLLRHGRERMAMPVLQGVWSLLTLHGPYSH